MVGYAPERNPRLACLEGDVPALFINYIEQQKQELRIKNQELSSTMKKIGILFGQENSFPQAFVDRVNQKTEKNITAEFVRIDKVMQAEPLDYSVIIDRISQDVPFYRATLKNAAICGTAVINNPFWWSADEKFFNNALAVKLGIPVPKDRYPPIKGSA